MRSLTPDVRRTYLAQALAEHLYGYFYVKGYASPMHWEAPPGQDRLGALRADLKMAQIAARDIGEAAARRLLALDWTARTVQELQGQRDLTMSEVAAVLGQAIGKPDLRYVPFPYADAEKGMVAAGLPQEMAALYAEMSKGFNEGHLRATQPRSAATTTPTSLEKWAAERFAPAFRAS